MFVGSRLWELGTAGPKTHSTFHGGSFRKGKELGRRRAGWHNRKKKKIKEKQQQKFGPNRGQRNKMEVPKEQIEMAKGPPSISTPLKDHYSGWMVNNL